MREALSVVGQSIAQEKARHVTGVIVTGTGATVGTAGSIAGEVLGWLPHVAVVAGLMVSCFLLYKTYLEIQILKRNLAKESEQGDG